MMKQLILCRYGELWLKSRPVMEKFYSRLVSNMHKMLEKEDIDFKICRQRNRAFIETGSPQKAIDVLKRVFGLVSVSPVLKVEMDTDLVKDKLLAIAEKKLKKNKKSFAVRVKRVGTHEFTSKELESRWGYAIGARHTNPVNLTAPDITFSIEVRNDDAYIFTETYLCAGGLPVGVEGTVAALIDSEESLVAAYMIMKRGCSIVALAKDKALAEKLIRFTTGLTIIRYTSTYAAALRQAIEKYEAKAFVSGETLKNMTGLEKTTGLPVLRPLIGLDIKQTKTNLFKPNTVYI